VIKKICKNCKYYPNECRAYSEGSPFPYDCCEDWTPREDLVLKEIWNKLVKIEETQEIMRWEHIALGIMIFITLLILSGCLK